MKTSSRLLIVSLFLLSADSITFAQQETQGSAVLVGHISYVEGRLLRYVPEEKDWVAAVKDAPFGTEDTLYAAETAKAEFIMPNNTRIRIGGTTQIQLLRLEPEVTEADVASGIARFYNKSSQAMIRVTTPFGSVVGPPQTAFDLYVGDASAEVIAVQGKVDFIHAGGSTKYEVFTGSSSIIANKGLVTSGEGRGDAAWGDWNSQQDTIWERRLAAKGDSTKYIPEQLNDEAYALEENGRWDRVYYDGGYNYFWRPVYVQPGWAPFTAGRWTVWYGDNCWIPDEPFGYVTHHYGSWVFVDSSNCWYWAPPVSYVRVVSGPSWYMGCSWYPGRVSWIYTDYYIGWIPLTPYEPYYCHHYWGPYSSVVIDDHDHNHHHKHHHEGHAVVVNHDKFYSVNNYGPVRVRNIDRETIFNKYHGAPVVSDRIIKNFRDLKDKYNFGDIKVFNKPHDSVLERIQKNLAHTKGPGVFNSRTFQQKLDNMKQGKPFKGIDITPYKITSKLVPEKDVDKPRFATKFKTYDLINKGQTQKEPVISKTPDTRPRPNALKDLKPGQFERPDTFKTETQRPKPFQDLLQSKPDGRTGPVAAKPALQQPKPAQDTGRSQPWQQVWTPKSTDNDRKPDMPRVKPEVYSDQPVKPKPFLDRPQPPRETGGLKPERFNQPQHPLQVPSQPRTRDQGYQFQPRPYEPPKTAPDRYRPTLVPQPQSETAPVQKERLVFPRQNRERLFQSRTESTAPSMDRPAQSNAVRELFQQQKDTPRFYTAPQGRR